MPRTYRKAELWSGVTAVGYIREQTGTHGNTTVKTGGVAADVVLCPVTATANFTNGDPVFIGANEKMEFNQIEAAPADPMPLKYPTYRAHDAAESFVEAARTVMGDISDTGVRLTPGGDFNAIRSATNRLVQGYLLGHLEQTIEFDVENFNLENLATAHGESDVPSAAAGPITGAGSAADPYRLVVDGVDYAVPQPSQVFYFTGGLKGGAIVEIQAWGAEVDPTAPQQTFARGQATYTPVRARPTAGVSYELY